jgi:hypothetical protein
VHTLPGVSVLCPTYGRTRTLVELIESFYRQTYAGPVELVILNDLVQQNLVLHPSIIRSDRPVDILTAAERFPTLGAKRNTLLDLAQYPLVAFWDDDDIYLPGFLEGAVRRYEAAAKQGWRMSRASHSWLLSGDPPVLRVMDGGPFWTAVVERDLLLALDGFPLQDTQADVVLFDRMNAAGLVPGESNTPGMPQFIRRWGTTPYEQVSILRLEKHPGTSDMERRCLYTADVQRRLDKGLEPSGSVVLRPMWNSPYDTIAQAVFGDRDRPNMNEPPSRAIGPSLERLRGLH